MSSPVQGEIHKSGLRYGLVLPLAGVATLVLTTSMAAMIAVEFVPQDKAQSLAFEINPVPDDLPPTIDIPEPDPLREVDIPPPPPTLPVEKVAAVVEPFHDIVGDIMPFDPSDMGLGFEAFDSVPIDADPAPINRLPPVFPARFLQGENSGYCKVNFDVSVEGQPFNVVTTECTHAVLKSSTIRSVQKWKYVPEIREGRPVSRSGLRTTIRFDLRDERGDVLPLPSGA